MDYQGSVVFEWQRKLLAEQSILTNNAMEVTVPVDGARSLPLLESVPNKSHHAGTSGPPLSKPRCGSYSSPLRQGGRSNIPPNYPPLPQRRPRGSSHTPGGGRGRGLGYQNSGFSHNRFNYGSGQMNNSYGAPPFPRL